MSVPVIIQQHQRPRGERRELRHPLRVQMAWSLVQMMHAGRREHLHASIGGGMFGDAKGAQPDAVELTKHEEQTYQNCLDMIGLYVIGKDDAGGKDESGAAALQRQIEELGREIAEARQTQRHFSAFIDRCVDALGGAAVIGDGEGVPQAIYRRLREERAAGAQAVVDQFNAIEGSETRPAPPSESGGGG
jgi:hypothetical protein